MADPIPKKSEWPLEYVAEVASINPSYKTTTGLQYPFVSMDDVRALKDGILEAYLDRYSIKDAIDDNSARTFTHTNHDS